MELNVKMSAFELLLIEEVKKYPILYDSSHNEYKDILKTNRLWENIAETLQHVGQVPFIKGKWRSLRDGYARARRKRLITKGKKAPHYKYYQQLSFLKNVIKHKDEARKDKGSEDLHENHPREPSEIFVPRVVIKEEEIERSSEDRLLLASLETPSSTSHDGSEFSLPDGEEHLFNEISEEEGNVRDRDVLVSGVLETLKTLLEQARQKDEEEAFCLYVAASLKKLSSKSKIEAKLKIQQVIHEFELRELLCRNTEINKNLRLD